MGKKLIAVLLSGLLAWFDTMPLLAGSADQSQLPEWVEKSYLELLETERKHGVPVAYDNKLAKIDLMEKWPAKRKEIEALVDSGEARQRRYGEVEDIGVRVIKEGQEKDIKVGEDAIREMKSYGLIPPAGRRRRNRR